jgi:hypothetical protein
MMAPALMEVHMNDRSTRVSVAVLLTSIDIAVFNHFSGTIWMAFSDVSWIRITITLTILVWTASAAVLWLHIAYDARQLLYECRVDAALRSSNKPNEMRRDCDV